MVSKGPFCVVVFGRKASIYRHVDRVRGRFHNEDTCCRNSGLERDRSRAEVDMRCDRRYSRLDVSLRNSANSDVDGFKRGNREERRYLGSDLFSTSEI